eukprot:CAMPEP_0195509536 /NCGR_PEP_ID=MMETSP0794_2-20130614/2446_1 /TAXON_ID=515487 /ORGANISM="Stephanopyxis turris, Strain CCMP 815" /LENGTH=231 /DNA_ID=CAMNT_0040636781 /DNA_START=1012 /DNA_END=1707 /DNA_ORIENTATION=+
MRLTSSRSLTSKILRDWSNTKRRQIRSIDNDSEQSAGTRWKVFVRCCCGRIKNVWLAGTSSENQQVGELAVEHFVQDVDTLIERKRRLSTVRPAKNTDVENDCFIPDRVMNSSACLSVQEERFTARLSISMKKCLVADIIKEQETNGMYVRQDGNDVDLLEKKRRSLMCSTEKDIPVNDSFSSDNPDDVVIDRLSPLHEESLAAMTEEEPREISKLDIQYPVVGFFPLQWG